MEYNFRDIEKKWQKKWIDDKVYQVPDVSPKPKYYVLDMFPYPSGAGLHVGHPLGYIASDIFARYKRLKGFNVLHPMGYDSFGLPAEQYAIEHGVHPAESTEKNIATFRKQLDNIGFSFDWSREVRTSDPNYYKWTQWIFLQLFKSWYNRTTNKTEPIDGLIKIFEQEGNAGYPVPDSGFRIPATQATFSDDESENASDTDHSISGAGSSVSTSAHQPTNTETTDTKTAANNDQQTTSKPHSSATNDQRPTTNPQSFTSLDWQGFDEKTKQAILMEYRVAFCGYGEVNWCEALGTVLANDEVVNGVSERGGYPVEKKRLRQWYLRITEYADRLLQGLQTVDFSDAMKDMQSNWIGKSTGAEIEFFCLIPQPLLLAEKGSKQPPAKEESSGHYFQSADIAQWQNLKTFGRENRKSFTEAEDILWQGIRNNKLGVKVRRQHTIQGYIVDFALLTEKLVIEIDGDYHNEEEQVKYDNARTAWFNELGLHVLRFTNNEVINDTQAVLNKIKQAVEQGTKKSGVSTPLLREEKGLGDEAEWSKNAPPPSFKIACYTTRPDTIFGVDFLVLAPEHDLVNQITTTEQKEAVDEYITYVKSRSERERMAEKTITGAFTGAYAAHPFTGKQVPVWISEYVLAGYGTGAIMAVPSGDERDHKFAKHFNLPITNIVGPAYNGEEAYSSKDLVLHNSDFLTGMNYDGAMEVVLKKLEEIGAGHRKVNYKMRDAAFSRQRYWGEPFPIVWEDGVAYPLEESELPLELPQVETYKPGPDGEGPLANIEDWYLIPDPSPQVAKGETTVASLAPLSARGEELGMRSVRRRETNTMPGYAGSSWYFLRYMNPHNDQTFCDKNISTYWNQVDLYVGGTEHAVGHLLYSRMWTKCLYDLGLITFDEPFKRLLNQGMIQGSSRIIYRLDNYEAGSSNKNRIENTQVFISKSLRDKSFIQDDKLNTEAHTVLNNFFDVEITQYKNWRFTKITELYVDVNIVNGVELDIDAFRNSKLEYKDAKFILEDGKYICATEVEKMSKSKYNTVNPDNIVDRYGADTFRMYEMFLGPVEQSKPWDTKGIEGVHRFLKKLWRLFYQEDNLIVTDETPTPAELKVLHKTIKKIEEDTERFSFNTCISAFMVCVNELTDLKCHKKEVLSPLLILLTPYAPHVACELWEVLNTISIKESSDRLILDATFPKWDKKYLEETSKEYPISINGRLRTTIIMDLSAQQPEVETIVLNNEVVKKWLDGNEPKKIIYVNNKMVNIVV